MLLCGDMMTDQTDFLEKYDIRCEICGKRSVEWDTWFNWQPCEDHRHLTPTEYQDMKDKVKNDRI